MPDWISGVLATPGLGWLFLTVVVGGLVRGFAGFGTALIIMPVASSVLTPAGALTVLVVVDLLGPIPNLPGAYRTCNRTDVMRLGLGTLIALPVGLYGLSHMPEEVFGWLVSVLVLATLMALMIGWRYHGKLTPPLILGTGATAGVLGGATGLAGPPVIMLYMASTLPGAVVRATLLLYLFVLDSMMIVMLAAFGMLDPAMVLIGLVLLLPFVAANVIGGQLFKFGSERQFRAVAYTIIAGSAILGLPLWH